MEKNQNQNLTNNMFITLEGGEGSGKTTLITRLKDELLKNGQEVLVTREPGGTRFGEMMRDWLLNHNAELAIGSKAELLLFLAARVQHIEEVIQPALDQGKIVICDRFQDSTIAYQGEARNLGVEFVEKLCKLSCNHISPTLTLLLDLDPVIGLERTRKISKEHAVSGQFDRIESEKLSFHQQVRAAMLNIAKHEPERVKVIDATKSLDDVFNESWKEVEKLLEKKL